ncbi:hypothetical protein ACWD4O_12335 [Streptomyces sp. NPDC002623]
MGQEAQTAALRACRLARVCVAGLDQAQMICVIWRFVDGRAVEIWDHFADVSAWDAFWESPADPGTEAGTR